MTPGISSGNWGCTSRLPDPVVVRPGVGSGAGGVRVGCRRVGSQVLPEATRLFSTHVVQATAVLGLYQAFTLTIFADDHQAQFAIDPSFAVPVTAGGTNLHFSGQDQFFHGRQR